MHLKTAFAVTVLLILTFLSLPLPTFALPATSPSSSSSAIVGVFQEVQEQAASFRDSIRAYNNQLRQLPSVIAAAYQTRTLSQLLANELADIDMFSEADSALIQKECVAIMDVSIEALGLVKKKIPYSERYGCKGLVRQLVEVYRAEDMGLVKQVQKRMAAADNEAMAEKVEDFGRAYDALFVASG